MRVRTPTHEALLSLCRQRLTPLDRARLATSCAARQIDWSELVRLAGTGGVAGLIGRGLEQLAAEGLPVPRTAQLELAQRALLVQAQNEELVAEARALLSLAKARGLLLVPLKGTALYLGGLYRDLGLRSMCDIDLLGRPSELPALEALLRERGFASGGARERYLRFSQHLEFVRRGRNGELLVELHWTALHAMYCQPAEDARIMSRCERQSGEDAQLLAPADLLLTVLLHFAVHRYRAQLKWLVDVAELCRAHGPAIDWAAFWQTARRLGALRAAVLGLQLAAQLLEVTIPAPPAPPLLALLAALSSADELIASAPQPSWLRCSLINLLQYDTPVAGLQFLSRKGAELLERYFGLWLPAALTGRARLGEP